MKISQIYGKIKSGFYIIFNFPKRVFLWLVKSFQYSVFLWNDVDFDYSSVFDLLRYKIGRMRGCILKNDIILKAELVASQMEHVEKLIQKYTDGDFCKELQDEHRKKWGKTSFVKTQHSFIITRENATTDALRDLEREELMEILLKEQKEQDLILKSIFDYLYKHIESWWD